MGIFFVFSFGDFEGHDVDSWYFLQEICDAIVFKASVEVNFLKNLGCIAEYLHPALYPILAE